MPLPGGVPEVIWRQGIDPNPLDPASDDDVRWLEYVIWPGEAGRVERLRESVAAARRHPVTVRRGNLVDDLAAVVSEAPREVRVVVFHTAVLAYVDADKRAAFADVVGGMGVTWQSNERSGVLGWLPTATDIDPHGTWLRRRRPVHCALSSSRCGAGVAPDSSRSPLSTPTPR